MNEFEESRRRILRAASAMTNGMTGLQERLDRLERSRQRVLRPHDLRLISGEPRMPSAWKTPIPGPPSSH